MFIAHLPAGYLLSRLHPALRDKAAWVLAGSILPDLDLFYVYIIGVGATHHHSYLTHRPACWLALLILSVALRRTKIALIPSAFCVGALLHLGLDSVAGAIAWGWPVSNTPTPMVVVPATHNWWVLSFLTHWTFALELAICAAAAVVFFLQRVRDTRTLRG